MKHRSYPVILRESEDDEPIGEAATAKAAVLAGARSIEDILNHKDVSEETKTAARSFRAMLRKTWATMKGEGEPPEPQPATEAAIEAFESIPLVEARTGKNEFDVRVIKPGWGASGYYTPEALQDAARARIFPAGLKMYWNHPTKTEERERPERDLRDLAGTLREDARWLDRGPEGPGLYAPIRVVEGYSGTVKELAEHIGVSIRATGRAKDGQAEGRRGRIIEAITGAQSVDFVTQPGAGGKIIALFEAARAHTSEDDAMELKEALEAKEAAEAKVAEAEKELAALREARQRDAEAALLREARDHVSGKLAQRKLPDVTRARLVESVSARASAVEGKLDKEALDKALDEAVKEEAAYLESVLGKNRVSGMGDAPQGASGEEAAKEADAKLDDAFARLGLSESARKHAVSGR